MREMSASSDSRSLAFCPMTTTISTSSAPAAAVAPSACQLGSSLPRQVGPPPQVGDHEQEHDHDSACIDEHLRRRDELGREEQEEDGERAEVAD